MAFLSLSATLPVLAQEPTEDQAPPAELEISVSLSLVGPPGCGSEGDLASRIAWRTSRVRIVPIGASERRLEVTLEVAEGAATATLSLTLPNGRRATRVLRAATCDEAVDAAALVAAVTLDPTASTDPTTPVPDAGSPATGGTAGAGGTTPLPPPTARPAEGTGGTGGTAPTSSRSELSGSLLVTGDTVIGPAPSPLIGFGGAIVGLWDRDSILSPALRVGLVYFPGRTFEATGGTAFFALTALNLDACPFRVGERSFGAFVCASYTHGWLDARGRRTNEPLSEVRPWDVFAGTLLLDWRPIEYLEVQLLGSVGGPLVRDQFAFKPLVFHTVPPVSGRAGIALGGFFR